MDELANPTSPRKEFINNHCLEFMKMIKDEIKSACEYGPFEKCDYSSRISNEICCKKLEYILSQLDRDKQSLQDFIACLHSVAAASRSKVPMGSNETKQPEKPKFTSDEQALHISTGESRLEKGRRPARGHRVLRWLWREKWGEEGSVK
ncbi:hypothetical protein GQ457_09G001070 [Hibiscus cannabinus]